MLKRFLILLETRISHVYTLESQTNQSGVIELHGLVFARLFYKFSKFKLRIYRQQQTPFVTPFTNCFVAPMTNSIRHQKHSSI
ncbi:TPA: hypothetical protein L6B36_21440 [Pseudomonas aeruginosa]|nr:hypothetical protein [Pseudomonas aeruginosa]